MPPEQHQRHTDAVEALSDPEPTVLRRESCDSLWGHENASRYLASIRGLSLARSAATASPSALNRRAFATALAVLAAEFSAYLEQDEADPLANLVGYRQHALWLTHDELTELIGELQRAIAPRLANGPAPARTRYLLSPILFPSAEPRALPRIPPLLRRDAARLPPPHNAAPLAPAVSRDTDSKAAAVAEPGAAQ